MATWKLMRGTDVRSPSPEYLPSNGPRWICEACGSVVSSVLDGNDGIVWTRIVQAQQVDDWHVHHMSCIPDPSSAYRDIGTEELATWADVTRWLRHYETKTWFDPERWRACFYPMSKPLWR